MLFQILHSNKASRTLTRHKIEYLLCLRAKTLMRSNFLTFWAKNIIAIFSRRLGLEQKTSDLLEEREKKRSRE